MDDTNIVAFPKKAAVRSAPVPDSSAILLAKINAALAAMTAVHTELEALRSRLRATKT